MRGSASVDAPAKVNLFLRVLDRRSDGFHELDTLFQAISLSDGVRVTLGGRVETPTGIHLRVDGPDLGPMEANLAYRAAAVFKQLSGLHDPLTIDLAKRIPAGAGLGGGSSDAAAVLKCLAALTGFDDASALHAAATGLGSDVPFFLGTSSLARGRGRGERLAELPPLPEASLVLALPPVHVATGGAYAALAARRVALGARRAVSTSSPSAMEVEEVDGLGDPVASPRSWEDVADIAHNDFEAVVAPVHPEIDASLGSLREGGTRFALLSGSGAASFGLFADAERAQGAAAWLSGRHGFPFLAVTTLAAMPVPHVERG